MPHAEGAESAAGNPGEAAAVAMIAKVETGADADAASEHCSHNRQYAAAAANYPAPDVE